jgi:hypothetical protein
VAEFLRPEDGAWDPLLPTRFYFVTTDRFDETKPDAADPDAAPSLEEAHTPSSVPQEPEEPEIGRSRLWQLDFEDLSDPSRGGALTMLLDGTEAHQMLDNITVSDDGMILMQEDPGDNPYLAKIWQYNPDTDELALLAQHDPARFGSGADSEALTMNEEASGIIDVTGLLGEPGKNVYLLDVQAHYDRERELDEGGQLLTMIVDDMVEDGAMSGTSSLDPWI